ncbi:hypothetical protein ID866_13302 [Astraeus odoratus]|nr:hypothetical protein ID866_13302 [Astraeus odoratus]
MVAAPLQVAKPSRRMCVAGPSTPGQRASGAQDSYTRCCNKGTLCVLSTAKSKTTACKVCHHMKASCSWTKKMTGEAWKRKRMHHLEEVEDVEIVEISKDDKEEEVQSHFTVPSHLAEDHQDTLGALTTTLHIVHLYLPD